ncbi:hypothetical protein KDA_51120 [Dictyobacter alpinus]|uniref:Uncharacterized protein n=1 Tax=Dictyobacter alpinus TaxID=2014873 RepID=A0A402BE01_9CHLR|nr:hypothetical protein KDA_51120 [Dictyobacter alpinus]
MKVFALGSFTRTITDEHVMQIMRRKVLIVRESCGASLHRLEAFASSGLSTMIGNG